jgi:segregation and condensation protein B
MIRIAGRKNVVGSPFLYRTTKEFLVHFGLNTLQDLPRLEEFAEILGENVNEELVAVDQELAAAHEGTMSEADAAASAEFASVETREADEAREVSDDEPVAETDSALSEVLTDDVATEQEQLEESMGESEAEVEQPGAEDAESLESDADGDEVTAH